MAGVKGASGGPRENAGGPREGAGKPPKPQPLVDVPETDDPQEFLASVMNDKKADARLRIEAARALMPYKHAKTSAGGKKDAQGERAKLAAKGKYAPSAPPKLVVNNT
jgi:phage terminase small subunit